MWRCSPPLPTAFRERFCSANLWQLFLLPFTMKENDTARASTKEVESPLYFCRMSVSSMIRYRGTCVRASNISVSVILKLAHIFLNWEFIADQYDSSLNSGWLGNYFWKADFICLYFVSLPDVTIYPDGVFTSNEVLANQEKRCPNIIWRWSSTTC